MLFILLGRLAEFAVPLDSLPAGSCWGLLLGDDRSSLLLDLLFYVEHVLFLDVFRKAL